MKYAGLLSNSEFDTTCLIRKPRKPETKARTTKKTKTSLVQENFLQELDASGVEATITQVKVAEVVQGLGFSSARGSELRSTF